MTEGQTISSDKRIVDLLELLVNNQMNTQAEQVKQLCGYVGTLEQQLSSMTEEIKAVRQELVFMKEKTLSKHVKDNIQKDDGYYTETVQLPHFQIYKEYSQAPIIYQFVSCFAGKFF